MIKHLIAGLLLTIIGISMMFGGFAVILNQRNARGMTDEQVIERAKALGMVELKDAIKGIE